MLNMATTNAQQHTTGYYTSCIKPASGLVVMMFMCLKLHCGYTVQKHNARTHTRTHTSHKVIFIPPSVQRTTCKLVLHCVVLLLVPPARVCADCLVPEPVVLVGLTSNYVTQKFVENTVQTVRLCVAKPTHRRDMHGTRRTAWEKRGQFPRSPTK